MQPENKFLTSSRLVFAFAFIPLSFSRPSSFCSPRVSFNTWIFIILNGHPGNSGYYSKNLWDFFVTFLILGDQCPVTFQAMAYNCSVNQKIGNSSRLLTVCLSIISNSPLKLPLLLAVISCLPLIRKNSLQMICIHNYVVNCVLCFWAFVFMLCAIFASTSICFDLSSFEAVATSCNVTCGYPMRINSILNWGLRRLKLLPLPSPPPPLPPFQQRKFNTVGQLPLSSSQLEGGLRLAQRFFQNLLAKMQ